MSQASRRVKWCLNKAKKEVEECEKLGKRPKHRGLLKTKSNINEAKGHIAKAEHNLKASEYLGKEFSDISTSTIFYSMYHCFLAIATKFGYESGNQTCTIALMEYLKEENKINIDSKFINMFKYEEAKERKDSVIEMREDYTYGTKISVNEIEIKDLIKTAKELIELTKNIIY